MKVHIFDGHIMSVSKWAQDLNLAAFSFNQKCWTENDQVDASRLSVMQPYRNEKRILIMKTDLKYGESLEKTVR